MLFQAVELGLIYGLLPLGMWLTSHVLQFDDLSIEGSFVIGGALTATSLSWDVWPPFALLAGATAGAVCGFTTAALHHYLGLNNLLSAIVVNAAAFSLSLSLATATHVISGPTLFSLIHHKHLMLLLPLAALIIVLIMRLLKSECGLVMYATGRNKTMVMELGKYPQNYLAIALIISNSLAALAGGLLVNYTGFFSVWSGVGIAVITLASFLIGSVIHNSFGPLLIAGSIAYQIIISLSYQWDIPAEWHRLVSALIIVGITMLLKRKKDAHAQ